MKVLDRNITTWQAGILLFILLFANKILLLPSLLYEGAKMESIFVPVILFLLEIGLLFLFYKLKMKYPTEKFSEIVKKHFGKTVKVVLYICLAIFFLSKAILLYNVTYVFFRNLIYKDAGNFLFLFCFIPIINHMAICGLRVMGRTAQLFFPVIVIIVIFCLIVGVFDITSAPLWFEGSALDVLKIGLKHISSFGDVIFLFVIMDRVRVKKGDWKILFSLASVAAILVIAIAFIFMLSYTYTSFMHSYALFEIMSFVKEYGGLGRIDIISMVVIVLFSYFHLAIYLKSFMFSFQEIFPKISEIYSVLTFDLLFLVVVEFFIVNLESTIFYSESILPYVTIISFAVIPIFSTIFIFTKKRKEAPR